LDFDFWHWWGRVTPELARVTLEPEVVFDKPLMDHIFASVGIGWALLDGGVVLHASAVVTPDGAVAFAAPSGTGKSTVARRLAPEAVLADDQTVLLPGSRGWSAACTAWGAGRAEPLARIHLLARARRTQSLRLSPAEAVPGILRNAVFWPGGPQLHRKLMANVCELIDAVDCRRLEFSLHDLSMEKITEEA